MSAHVQIIPREAPIARMGGDGRRVVPIIEIDSAAQINLGGQSTNDQVRWLRLLSERAADLADEVERGRD